MVKHVPAGSPEGGRFAPENKGKDNLPKVAKVIQKTILATQPSTAKGKDSVSSAINKFQIIKDKTSKSEYKILDDALKSNKELFHGTLEYLKPGDIIAPRLAGEAFASPDQKIAMKHAASWLYFGREGYPEASHANLYKVEPLEDDGTLSSPKDSDGGVEVTSRAGFRVVEQVASILKPTISPTNQNSPFATKPIFDS